MNLRLMASGILIGLIVAGCANEPVAAPTSNRPATTTAAAPTGSRPTPVTDQFAAQIASATSQLSGCTVGADPTDPGCGDALTVMVSLAFDIDRTVRSRSDAGVYADTFSTIDSIRDASKGFSDDRCYNGFTGGLSGGTARDQSCTAWGFSLRLQWQTLTMQLDTAETRAGY